MKAGEDSRCQVVEGTARVVSINYTTIILAIEFCQAAAQFVISMHVGRLWCPLHGG